MSDEVINVVQIPQRNYVATINDTKRNDRPYGFIVREDFVETEDKQYYFTTKWGSDGPNERGLDQPSFASFEEAVEFAKRQVLEIYTTLE